MSEAFNEEWNLSMPTDLTDRPHSNPHPNKNIFLFSFSFKKKSWVLMEVEINHQ